MKPAAALGVVAALASPAALGADTAPARRVSETRRAAAERRLVDRDPPPSAWTERDPDRLGWYVPDYAKLQTGSYLGLFGVGLGYAIFDDVLNVTAFYGYTPPWLEEVHVHALGATLSVRPFDERFGPVRIVPMYFGGGFLYALDGDFFTSLPEHYDDGYYGPISIQASVHAGAEVDVLPEADNPIERHGIYGELTALHGGIEMLVVNPSTVKLYDVVGAGLGYRLAF